MNEGGESIPLNSKPGDTRLLSEHVAAYLLDYRLGRGIVDQILIIILVVHIVAHADELASVVGTSEQYHGHTEELINRNALRVRRVGLKDELIDTHGDGTDKEGVKLLIVVVGLRRADVGELPLEI